MTDQILVEVLREVRELKEQLAQKSRSDAEKTAHAAGLLSYEDLQDRLTVGRKNPRRPSLRTVKTLVERLRHIVLPVELGHKTVGFREASVERLISHLAGENSSRRDR